MTENRIVSAEKNIRAAASDIFKILADPAQHARIDGNGNVDHADQGQRITNSGQVFEARLTNGESRENRVVEFEEGRVIAWKPAVPGSEPRGHLFRWELEPVDDNATLVRHTYDWTELTDETRFERARSYTSAALASSIDGLAALAEDEGAGSEEG